MHIDFIALVKDTLKHLHCEDRLADELDPHAPVELHFNSLPTIKIEQVEDSAIRLSCQLSETMGLPSGCAAGALIETVAKPADWAEHQCVSLLEVDGSLSLQATAAKSLVQDAAQFSFAVAGFYDRASEAMKTLR